MNIISNASPIVSLARASLLYLLKDLFGQITISEEVYQELVIQGKGKAGEAEIKGADWIRVEGIRDQNLLLQFHVHGLSTKDASVIALAKERGAALVILDEEKARKVTKEAGLPIIGTGGILLQAKKQGLLRSVKEALDLLIQHKIYLHKNLYKEILKEAGEEVTHSSHQRPISTFQTLEVLALVFLF